MVKRQRRTKYKNLRKVRKARDMASAATRKKEPWKTSRVLQRFQTDISSSTTKGLANLIYHHMPKHSNPPRPVSRKK